MKVKLKPVARIPAKRKPVNLAKLKSRIKYVSVESAMPHMIAEFFAGGRPDEIAKRYSKIIYGNPDPKRIIVRIAETREKKNEMMSNHIAQLKPKIKHKAKQEILRSKKETAIIESAVTEIERKIKEHMDFMDSRLAQARERMPEITAATMGGDLDFMDKYDKIARRHYDIESQKRDDAAFNLNVIVGFDPTQSREEQPQERLAEGRVL